MKIKNHNQNIYTRMQRFAEITKTLIRQGDIERTKYCMSKAEELFNEGTLEIKNAVVNVYIFSVSSFMEIHNCNIKNLFPASLHNEYYKQVNACCK